MNFFKITLSQGLAFDQTTLIEALKQDGGDCIQSSAGLFAASTWSKAELQLKLEALDASGALQIEEVTAGTNLSQLSLDMQNFMKKHLD